MYALLCLVDVAAALAEVEVGLVLRRHSVESQQRRVLVLVAQTALVASEDRLHVQSAGLGAGSHNCLLGCFSHSEKYQETCSHNVYYEFPKIHYKALIL